MKKYKLIGLDLDGTVTQHKSKLEDANKQVLDYLCKHYKCVMVGAGSCERIYKQLNAYPIDIIGNYGMQVSTVVNDDFFIIKNDSYSVDKQWFDTTVSNLRQLTGYTAYIGDNVEFHNTGAVTFPLLGTKADLTDKLAFDPDGKKRTKIYDIVAKAFAEYNCFIGGTSSFDIVKKDYDKYQALTQYAQKVGIEDQHILYIGDDFKKGGNDEHVMLGGIDCIHIKNYRDLLSMVEAKGLWEK